MTITIRSQESQSRIKEVFDELKEKIEQVDSAGRKRKASIYWEPCIKESENNGYDRARKNQWT